MTGRENSRGGTMTAAVDLLLTQLHDQSRATLRDRLQRVRANAIIAAQTGLAAALAWFIAADLLRHPSPFFAPIAAVITLAISVGQRLRRAAELVLGVALGIAVGDALIYLIGTGFWQIGLVVGLAIIAAVFVGGTAPLIVQAASSAVLVATLAPPSTGIYYLRFLDALIGGGVALGVMALLLPANPLTVVAKAAGNALEVLADGLSETAAALSAGDAARADAALDRLRGGEAELIHFKDVLPAGRETATIAPLRWRARGALVQYVDAAEHVTHAMRNARVLARRTVTLLRDGEPVPEVLAEAVDSLAEAVRALRHELAEGRTPNRARDLAVQAVRHAAEAYATGLGFSGHVVVAQIRTVATDLLGSAGLTHGEANRLVRKAGGDPAKKAR
jgi:uncharacterized membrane protein YgaE (UPF0421/DUF939 family)